MGSSAEIFDVIAIGGGHAGIEAALAAARMGAKTLLLTANIDTIGRMSCNPAIGGLAKGHIVRELDALGGEMAKTTDATGIQFRRLNTKKGPAVRGTRAQSDKWLYERMMQEKLKQEANLTLKTGIVEGLITSKSGGGLKIQGVVTGRGEEFRGKTVVLTTGTFLRGILHIGPKKLEGGRIDEEPVRGLTAALVKLGFSIGRLKTGTPPRLDAASLDFTAMTPQPGDDPPPKFSFEPIENKLPQVNCYLTQTSDAETHRIIRENIHRSPLFSGQIEGVGPRYCPSIEDKVVRFPEKNSHHIFIEPEGVNTNSVYPNGMSTSLPIDVQEAMIRSLPGCKQAVFIRPGYAVEYDFADPRQLKPTLETKLVDNLYFAGQTNGTSGYEEAAGQGFIAGVNAVLKLRGEEPFVLKRHEAYIGVLIDDLVTKGTAEPYRMFTSRAEYRLLMREDNADLRLTQYGYKLGLISKKRFEAVVNKKRRIELAENAMRNFRVNPTREVNALLEKWGSPPLVSPIEAFALMRRPDINLEKVKTFVEGLIELTAEEAEQLEIIARYDGYLKRQEEEAGRMNELERVKIPQDFVYKGISGLSNEIMEKLDRIKPQTLGQAARISGVTPAAVSLLWIRIKAPS